MVPEDLGDGNGGSLLGLALELGERLGLGDLAT